MKFNSQYDTWEWTRDNFPVWLYRLVVLFRALVMEGKSKAGGEIGRLLRAHSQVFCAIKEIENESVF